MIRFLLASLCLTLLASRKHQDHLVSLATALGIDPPNPSIVD